MSNLRKTQNKTKGKSLSDKPNRSQEKGQLLITKMRLVHKPSCFRKLVVGWVKVRSLNSAFTWLPFFNLSAKCISALKVIFGLILTKHTFYTSGSETEAPWMTKNLENIFYNSFDLRTTLIQYIIDSLHWFIDILSLVPPRSSFCLLLLMTHLLVGCMI